MVLNQHPKDKSYEAVDMENDDKPVGSPLIDAARTGNVDLLCEYLDKGGNIFENDQTYKASLLHYAAYNDDFEKAKQCTDELLDRALRKAGKEGLKRLVEQVDTGQKTALFWALAKGNYHVVRSLLNRGAKLGFIRRNESAFHVTAKLENHQNALNCAKVLLDAKYYGTVELLLKYLNAEESDSARTALHRAAISGNHELIQLLISNGADALKMDFVDCNVLHHAVGNAREFRALKCTQILMQDDLIDNWNLTRANLMDCFNRKGQFPIHIAARRGFSKILELMPTQYLIPEKSTGYTVLHSSASLGSQTKAALCVKRILKTVEPEEKQELLNIKDQNDCTALYLAAKHRNVEACKWLLLEGSAFDIKSKRGKTPLEKVYKNTPEAVSVLLEQSIKSSGYVAYLGSINTIAELNFEPILGKSSSKASLYKETEELAKVCYAKFDDRKSVLNHIMIRIFIHLKWERVKTFFIIFRFLHILWFLWNCFFLVTLYRVECPYSEANAKPYSWTSLRPEEKQLNVTKSLEECEISSGLRIGGALNLCGVTFYMLSQFHHSLQKFHWIFRPMKAFDPNKSLLFKICKTLSYYPALLIQILPCWPVLLTTGIVITTLPTLGVVPFDETAHYIIAGLMGLFIWIAIYLELGKFPRFRVYINLLMRSTRTLLFAITVTAPILFGFANVFVILIPGEPSFSSAAQSFVKVITFMIGELDYQGLFYGERETVFLGIVMLALAVFIVIIVVMLVNFLIGLAAEEIKDFGERADIWKLCTQLEQIVALESFLDETVTFCGREFLKRNLMLMPPEEHAEKQRRKARIDIPLLPKDLQKKLHELNLRTIEEVR